MSVFTLMTLDYVNSKLSWYNINIQYICAVGDGLDNTVYRLIDNNNYTYILKLYEWKDDFFKKKILNFHEQLDVFLIHKMILYSEDFIENKLWILFSYVETNWMYEIQKIIKKIGIFHEKLNPSQDIKNIESILDNVCDETEYFQKNISKNWYIEKYIWFIDLDYLFQLFRWSIWSIKTQNISLHFWCIHNDLCRWNIIPNDINEIEFIDFDWVNYNLLIKDYIILLIRFNNIQDIDKLFTVNKDFIYSVWRDYISKEVLNNLYITYSINLIFNMIYYIWYNSKNVDESNFIDTNNQTWQDILQNLKNNNFYQILSTNY